MKLRSDYYSVENECCKLKTLAIEIEVDNEYSTVQLLFSNSVCVNAESLFIEHPHKLQRHFFYTKSAVYSARQFL